MKTLILDNYDSFTYNLYQQVARISGCEPTVVANDQISLKEIKQRSFDVIIISPGPGRPDRAADFGICSEVLIELDLPILGVCLGFQGLGYFYGAKLVHAQELMHGRISQVIYKATPLFDGIPQKFKVARYHSLAISKDLPDTLDALAWTTNGVLMAIRHKRRPHWGVQFHPESIGTEYGDVLIQNFFDICEKYHRSRGVIIDAPSNITKPKLGVANHRNISLNETPSKKINWELHYRKLEQLVDPESVFLTLYADKEYAFWLGSDLVEKELSRFIYIGAADGPYAEVVTYHTDGMCLSVNTGEGISYYHESIFDYLKRALHDKYCINSALPFDFNCGFAGYFGYELLAECGGKSAHRSKLPDASFIFADRLIVFDQVDQKTYLVSLSLKGQEELSEKWFDEVEGEVKNIRKLNPIKPISNTTEPLKFSLLRNYKTYLSDIEQCAKELKEGESYEICLTNQIYTDPISQPLELYRVLRRVNPAPYASYLKFGDIAILSSSPEQFLKADATRLLSTKPIKGTTARHSNVAKDQIARNTLGTNEKDSSEHLMIVDLLRNDLGKVCEVGSVHVSKFMQVESYETVHQLVSTICGRLKTGATVIDFIRAAFPGGSMTGAPKIRTLEIISRLEKEARGIYSGSIGFLALNGTADLSIVIRTVVCAPDSTSIGIGGAIVALSDANEEFKETVLKARAVINAMIYAKKGEFGGQHFELEGMPKEILNTLPSLPVRINQPHGDRK